MADSGARRAAREICKELRLAGPGTEDWLFEIIERETACGELLAALKAILDSARDGRQVPEWLNERLIQAEAAIRKVEAGDGKR